MTKALYINGIFLTQPLTGVQRYCHEVLRAMDEIDPAVEIVCLAPPQDFEAPHWQQIRLEKIGRHRGNLWEQIDLPMWLKGGFLFSPSNVGPAFHYNQAVTIHDASVFAIPDAYRWRFKLKYRFVYRQMARHARLILTVSEFARRELSRWLGKDPKRFNVIYNGGDHLQHVTPNDSIIDRISLRGKRYFLSVATISRHKNLMGLIQAAAQVKDDILFVVVGDKYQRVFSSKDELPIPKNVIFTGHVNDPGELKALYQNAVGFIHPSLYDSFALPVMEAMSLGCPVLCSKSAAFPEIYTEAAMYFDPENVNDMADKITRFLANPALQADLRQRGLQRASQFTWERCAQQTLAHLLPLLDEGRPS